jgi:S1-C subfamily serine protease
MRAAVLFALLFTVTSTLSQDAVPGEILQRTIFIKSGNEAGTAFAVDHKGSLYLITARHVVAALPSTGGKIQIRQKGEWKDYEVIKKIFPSSDDVDIAVLQTNEKLPTAYGIKWTGTSGVTFGQQVWFLGYPYGLGSKFANGELPFIKRGTMSAIDGSNPEAIVLYIDGFNNPGFSGGPIIYWSFSDHIIQILGVVKGYQPESAKVMVNGVQQDTALLVNSGILIGYSVKHAFDAIEQADTPPAR